MNIVADSDLLLVSNKTLEKSLDFYVEGGGSFESFGDLRNYMMNCDTHLITAAENYAVYQNGKKLYLCLVTDDSDLGAGWLGAGWLGAGWLGFNFTFLDETSFDVDGITQYTPKDGIKRFAPKDFNTWNENGNTIQHYLCLYLMKVRAIHKYINKPKVVVVKETDEKRERAKSKCLDRNLMPRTHQRDVNIILDTEEVKTLCKYKGGTHASPVPHKRRAHKRVLRSPRYKYARGKVIDVGETEVGVKPGEVINHKKKIYHVVSVGGVHEDI